MKKKLININPVKDLVREKLIEKYNTTIFMNTDVVDVHVDIKEILEQHIADKQLTEPKIYITTEAYLKMRKLVDDTTTEIGWYGTVTKMPALDEVYIIEDILVYPQIVTGATCVQDDDKVFEFEMELTPEQTNHKRFHGHSHVNMSTGPSGVDENFYQDLLTQVQDYFIIAITNKRNDYTIRFYDVVNNILYTDLSLHILLADGTTLDDWYGAAKSKLKNKIEAPKPTPLTGHKSYVSPYAGPYDEDYEDGYYDPYIWDSRMGYIKRSEQKKLDKIDKKATRAINKKKK